MSPSAAPTPPLQQKAEANIRLLGILFALQLLLGAIWTVVLISTTGKAWGYYAIVLFVCLYPVHLVLMGIAAGSMRKYPANARFALLVLATPLVLLAVPFLVNFLAGGAPALRSPEQIRSTVLVLAVIPIVLSIFFPRKIARFLPNFLLRSFWLNLWILLVPLLMYAACGLALAKWSTLFAEASSDDAGDVIFYGLIFAWYFAAATIVPATLTFLYSYLGLFQSRERRRHGMRVAQLILSLPAVLLGVWVLFRIISKGSASP